ncbi:hypothetical protein [Pseudomonas avellanae]|uniref:hypothetical protein n=1 Tax=Pseudomonas avellanae TaxID=46257 RepID=UPI00028C8F50|nr:hypothetical protein [Pseudomonas avellanae]EKG33361.1 hypothetical protein Pav631_1116 [Pseudomonas avellanae BPIC 631]UQW69308.1 hypothetical protein L2Y00_01780 [Pseudomonas avellanae]UQW75447.1 hypothetical protein L2Y01_06365 [Pseudomonas avellanae]GGJ41559.1 hypothetical protein GCM10009085_39260 [Pseudomonas avellanae]
MENTVNTATARAINTTRPAGLETIPQSRSDRFAQILSQRVGDLTASESATLGKQDLPRSTFFMNNMSLEQRTSVINDKDFLPRPAAMERIADPQNRRLK